MLNRGSNCQVQGVRVIQADRHNLGDSLNGYSFDAVLDITAYTKQDIEDVLQALKGRFNDYIMISSSAVYPDCLPQPFNEQQPTGKNNVWGSYGSNKAAAEKALLQAVPNAYILRPPYLYGIEQNLYREPFVLDCALNHRTFYLPQDGSMPLQFFHVNDLCRFMDILLCQKPQQHIFNVGNKEPVTVKEWVQMCYDAVGEPLKTINVPQTVNQRDYFCFNNYGYVLDVTAHEKLMPQTEDLAHGIYSYYHDWYKEHKDGINRRDYFSFIDESLK